MIETTLTPERIAACTRIGAWPNRTPADDLDHWATVRPARVAIDDGARRLTYEDLARLADRVACGLQGLGVGPGVCVAAQLPNWAELLVLFLAGLRLGAPLIPIPPIYRGNELRFILRITEAPVLVIPAAFRNHDYTAMAAGMRRDLPRLEHVFVARGAAGEGMRPLADLTDMAWEARPERRALPGTDPNAVHQIIFTSGTTGEPKGVMHTPNTNLAMILPLVDRLRFTERDVVLMASTIGHQSGYLYGMVLPLAVGGAMVWMDVWNAEEATRLIATHGATYSMGATPFLQDLTYTPALARHDTSSLRLFISAGASIPRKLVQDARERLRCAISAGWGMTENGLATCNGLEDPEAKVCGTEGLPLPGVELRVVDDDERNLPAGAEGHLLVRGAGQFVGYFRRLEHTRACHTADGWFHTGDRAMLDAEGCLTIAGRSKDIIIRGGENIPVAEVENLLFGHPKVATVAVVAMPDPRLQERACAYVVPRPGETVTLEELMAYLASLQVAKFKWPERLEVVPELPMTPSGKIQKFRLRQDLLARLAAEGGRPHTG
jgi:cyclohexanecarboxylate-CoA ligase